MKTFVVISCLFVVAVLIMNPVQAAAQFYPNESHAFQGSGFVFKSETTNFSQIYTSGQICAIYGMPAFNNYVHIYFKKISDNTFWAAYDYPIGDQPVHFNAVTAGYDPTVYDEIGYQYGCVPGSGGSEAVIYDYYPYYNNSSQAPPPIANFTASPLNATAPAYVAFTDTSTNETETCTYNWSFTPTDGVLVAPQDLDNEDITMLFTENGDFTITHGVTCDAGSDIEEKVDYIHIYNSTALSTFRVRAVDALSGYGVNGAEVDVFDIENSSWTNRTSVTGEVTVTAITGHTINAYGSATGYDDGESLALPVVADSLYPVYMWPSSFVTNVSEGNVTLYVTVLEDGTNTRLSGIGVTLTGPSTGGADFTNGYTNDNGIYQTVIKNETDYKVTIIAQDGYLGANKVFNSGTGSGGDAYVEVTLWLQKNYITTAPTATTLPGGGTPAATLTYLPNCDPNAPDYDAAKCRTSKGSSGLNLLADNLENLILLCIVVTMFYLLGIRLGR